MPLYISVGGETYGVWATSDGNIGSAVPAAKKTAEINAQITKLQKDHQSSNKK